MSSRLERLKARLKEIPDRPGVYLHKNAEREVIYVGKARNLRNRVNAYLVGKGVRDPKMFALMSEIEQIDFVTTNNELEAILLENNLIKQHQPRYNILLRDDKTYPYIKVTTSEAYPRLVFTRRVDRKKGDLYYGPFFAGTARRILKLVADQFKLRSCDLDIVEGKNALARPCLYYDMHQCLGPCVVGLTTSEAYREMVDDVVLFLGGKTRELQDRLSERMYKSAEGESFELARYYRDLIRTVERIQAEQQVASAGDEDVDVWGLHEEGGDVAEARRLEECRVSVEEHVAAPRVPPPDLAEKYSSCREDLPSSSQCAGPGGRDHELDPLGAPLAFRHRHRSSVARPGIPRAGRSDEGSDLGTRLGRDSDLHRPT